MPIERDNQDDGGGFVSFVVRAYPLKRVGRGGTFEWGGRRSYRLAAYADEPQLPFVAVDTWSTVSETTSGGLFRFIHQCFGLVGELIGVLAILTATNLIFFALPVKRGAESPNRIQQSIVPNAPVVPPGIPNSPAAQPGQNTVPNAAAPGREPADSFPSRLVPRLPQQAPPNRAAEPPNPKANPDSKADGSGVTVK